MLQRLKHSQNAIYTGLIGLFFVLALHFKLSYSLIPILLALAGLYLLFQKVKQKSLSLPKEYRLLVASFVIYFLLFVLSYFIHHGKAKELDLPSRALLVLPVLLLLLNVALVPTRILAGLLIAANLAGIVALVQVFGLHLERPFPTQMHIQAGGIAMSLALFCLCLLFYFYPKQKRLPIIFSLTGFLFALVASFLTTARGAWVALPLLFLVILWFNRRLLSKKLIASVLVLSVIGGALTFPVLEKRVIQARDDINLYVEKQNGNSSVGARFDMWKSAVLGMQEKPLFGWGLEGVREMRQQHVQQGLVDPSIAQYAHAHNQYLQDGSARGILGLLSLLSIFFVPLSLFWRNLKREPATSTSALFGSLGIVHILAVMIYCLSQGFLSHNSGVIFYFFGVVVFLALQKITQNRPFVGEK